MGCLVMAYGPPVRSLCPSLTVGAALHMAPSASLAHTVSVVAASRIASPRTRSPGACISRGSQSVLGTATDKLTTTTVLIHMGDTKRARARSAGDRDS